MPRRERPLGPGDDVVLKFAAGLRDLREAAGGPTYRALSTRAGYSAAALSEAAGGRKLPGLALTTAYVTACDGDVAEWETRWRAVTAELVAEDGDKDAPADVPYLGLAAFQPGDAGRFFGREKLVAELSRKVRQRRFVGVFGASGSGKSSVLRAGLAAEAGERWAMVFTPGDHPLEQCAAGLATSGHLLIIDQFEEVFTLCHDDAERAAFIDALLALAADEHGTQVVIGVRADFYGHCGRHAGLVDALRDAQVMVGPMTADELRTAIVEPAVRLGCRVEAALVTTLVGDATGQPAVLPLVSHALLETWRRRQGITLTVAAYEAAGGIQNAIARTAEAAYNALAPDRQAVVRQVFLRLTALGEGTEDTKRRLNRRELDTDNPATTDVLDRLVDARLLALDRDGVEIAHEALIRSWPRLRDWLAEDREGHRLLRQLSEATDLWETLDRDPGSLYRGTRLALSAEWASRAPGLLTPREQAFLDAGLAAEAEEAAAVRRRTRRLRRLVALLAVLVVLAGATTAYAINAERTATDQRNVATARKVVGDAADLRATNPALSAQLSLAAYRLAPVQESHDGLLAALPMPFATRVDAGPDGLSGRDGAALSGDGRLLATAGDNATVQIWSLADPRHPVRLATLPNTRGTLHAPVALSRDGRTLAVGTGSLAMQVWDLSDPRVPVPRGTGAQHRKPIYSAVISADGRTLATGGDDGVLQLTDITAPAAPQPLARLDLLKDAEAVVGRFSPDGRFLVTSAGLTARLWDVTDRKKPVFKANLGTHGDVVNMPSFSPDGTLLSLPSWDHSVQLWNIADPANPRLANTLGTPALAWSAQFSPDGRTVAITGDDQIVRVWDVGDPAKAQELTELTGHTDTVMWAAFTGDGRTLVSSSGDRTLRLIGTDQLDLYSRGGGGAAKYTPDGRILVTSGFSTVRVWRVTGPQEVRELATIGGWPGRLSSFALSPDGRNLAIAILPDTTGGWIERWDISDPAHPRLLATLKGRATYGLAFSYDNRVLATGYDDGPTELWDISDSSKITAPVTFVTPAGTVWALRFSPDGKTLYDARGNAEAAVTVWDVRDRMHPKLTATLVSPTTGGFTSLSLSSDGHTLAAGSTDRLAYLWDVTDRYRPRLLATLAGHTGIVQSVSFAASGRMLVTAGSDHTARLWDISDVGHPVVTGTLTFANSVSAVLSPDGHTVATSSGSTQLRETDLDLVAQQICSVTAPKITPAEWEQYFPALPYNPPCP